MKINENIRQDFVKLGLQIKKLREERSLTIEELSLKCGIRKEYLLKIEKGIAYGIIIEKHLLKIVKVLNINFSTLFDYE